MRLRCFSYELRPFEHSGRCGVNKVRETGFPHSGLITGAEMKVLGHTHDVGTGIHIILGIGIEAKGIDMGWAEGNK